MSAVTLIGDTSGSVTLSAPATGGSNTVTFPNTSGNIVLADSNNLIALGLPMVTKTTLYTLAASDNGKLINTNSNITVSSGTLVSGQVVTIYNNSQSTYITITASGTTVRWAGTGSTGTRYLGTNGVCSIMCVGTDTYVISGTGLS